jgi:hypothetical protein
LVLQEAVVAGPPPLGPGAPARDRLLAFADGVDADLLAHLILAALHHDPIQRLLATDDGADRVADGRRTMITAVLDQDRAAGPG